MTQVTWQKFVVDRQLVQQLGVWTIKAHEDGVGLFIGTELFEKVPYLIDALKTAERYNGQHPSLRTEFDIIRDIELLWKMYEDEAKPLYDELVAIRLKAEPNQSATLSPDSPAKFR